MAATITVTCPVCEQTIGAWETNNLLQSVNLEATHEFHPVTVEEPGAVEAPA